MLIQHTARLAAWLLAGCLHGAAMAAALTLPSSGPAPGAFTITPIYQQNFDNTGGVFGYNQTARWYDISYGGANNATSPTVATPPWATQSGDLALKLTPNSLGTQGEGLQYILPLPFKQHTRYRVSFDAATAAGQSALLRVATFANTGGGYAMLITSQTVALNATRQRVSVHLVFSVPEDDSIGGLATGSTPALRLVPVAPLASGTTIYVDNIEVAEVKTEALNMAEDLGWGVASTAKPLPLNNRMHGLHVNELGTHNTWPKLEQQFIRLWGTDGSYWAALQPSATDWQPGLLSYHVDYVVRNNPSAGIIYTLGQTPEWAAGSRSPVCGYAYIHPSACVIPPMQPAAAWETFKARWGAYVKRVAQEYGSRIRFFELWNEPGTNVFFTGTPQQLVEMAQVAREALNQVDAGIKLVGPAATGPFLDDFLRLGGGKHIDIFNVHVYLSPTRTEPAVVAALANAKFMMRAYGLASKPLWNTESGVTCGSRGLLCPQGYIPSTTEQYGLMPRVIGMHWANGVSQYNFHFMEGWNRQAEPWSALVQARDPDSACVEVGPWFCFSEMPPTPLGVGYIKSSWWMQGMSLQSAFTVYNGGEPIHVLIMQSATSPLRRMLAWTSGKTNQVIKLPAAWRVQTAEFIDRSQAYTYDANGVGADLTLRPNEPVLLRP